MISGINHSVKLSNLLKIIAKNGQQWIFLSFFINVEKEDEDRKDKTVKKVVNNIRGCQKDR